MGIIVQFAGRSVWEPSLRVGYCFVAQVRTIEDLLSIKSGVGPVISDEVDINFAEFDNFLQDYLEKLEQTNNGPFFALTMGCIQVCISLHRKIGGKLPTISPKLRPLIEGATALENEIWRITSLEPAQEEVESRTGAIQDIGDWAVYPRK